MAYTYPFRMTSTTATLLLIDPVTEEVVTGIRSDNAWVYPDHDSLLGGFLEARYTEEMGEKAKAIRDVIIPMMNWKPMAEEFHEGEDVEATALREALEEMGLKLERHQLVLFAARTNSRTDTRAHVSNICFYVVLTPEQSALVPDGKDLSEYDDLKMVRRHKISEFFEELPWVVIENKFPMAFNHLEVLIQGLQAWKKEQHNEALEAEVQKLRDRCNELSWAAAGDRQGGA